MTDNNWRPVMALGNVTESPRDFERIEIWREGWAEPQATRWEDINPMMNAIGLMWRPVSAKRTPGPFQHRLSSAQFYGIMEQLHLVYSDLEPRPKM